MSKKAHTPTENETGPVVQERVERDRPHSTILAPKKAVSKKEPVTPVAAPVATPAPKKTAKKKATPKKRIRRTRAELIAAGYYTKSGKKAAHPPTKVPAPVAQAVAEAPVPKKRKRRGEWRKGRVWPVTTYTQTIEVQTKKPKALEVAIRKTIWKYAVRTRKKAKKA